MREQEVSLMREEVRLLQRAGDTGCRDEKTGGESDERGSQTEAESRRYRLQG